MMLYEYAKGFDEDGPNEPVMPSTWTINFIGKEEIPGGNSLSHALIALGHHVEKYDVSVLLLEVVHEHRQIKVIMEPRRWYVVVSKGKFSDGYYGWDYKLHSGAQIFAEEDLPYEPNTADIENVLVAISLYKPSVDDCILSRNRGHWAIDLGE